MAYISKIQMQHIASVYLILGIREGIQPSSYFIPNDFKGYSKV